MFEDQEIRNVQIAFRRIRFEAGDIIQARDECFDDSKIALFGNIAKGR
jgi:hypothetical protein